MATIVTRAGKGSPLTHVEVDANFTNLNADKAELASPTFTGTPAAPTATVGNSTTQIATTAFVNAEIANDAPTKTGTGASGTWAISISGNAATATSAASAINPTFSGDATTKDDITTRTESGFYQSSTGTTAEGWPRNDTQWQHLIASTHDNDANYYSMQIGAGFFTQQWYLRNTNGSGTTGWSEVFTTSNLSLAGAVAHFAMNTAPAGWLKANGAAVSRTTYATLFTAIGTTFGTGDGSTTFNVPDLRGEFIRGWDDARGVDTGRVFGSAQLDQFQGHGHTLTGRQHAAGSGSYNEFADTGAAEFYSNTTSVQDPVARSNGTPRTGNETRPRSIALLACIKF